MLYTTDDRLEIEIGDYIFKIAPLSVKQKMEVSETISKDDLLGAITAVKYALKGIKKKSDNSEAELEFENNALTEKSLDGVFNMQENKLLQHTALNLINSVPDVITNILTQKPLEGVKIISDSKKKTTPKEER